MGLDITAARCIERIGDSYEDGDGVYIGSQPAEFIPRADGLSPGMYRARESFSFRAGSYGGYNKWRNELAKLAGYPQRPLVDRRGVRELHAQGAWETDSGPFWELINFSDCEGSIGPKTSAKLAKDFAEHQTKAEAHPDEWFRELYAEWRKAFEMAADGGVVTFH